jgi:DNA-binding GntR family transcriptional regulator
LIIDASGNVIMKEILNRMETLIEVSRIPFRQARERLEKINREHIEITQALIKGDGELAARLMEHHLALTREAHLQILLGRGYPPQRAVNQR